MKEYPYRLAFLNVFVEETVVKEQAQEELGYLGKITVVSWEVEREMHFTANTLQGDLPWFQTLVKLTYTVA